MRFVLASLALCMTASAAITSPLAWVLNTNTTIDMVNVATNASVPFSATPFLSDSLARSASGVLYSANGNGGIWNVTGPPIPVGVTGRTQIGDLDWDNNGLWGFSNTTS